MSPRGEAADFVQRGKVLIVRRQFQEAVKVCRLGLLAAPTNVEGRLVLGMALIALGRFDEVLAEMRVALERDPDNAMAHLLKGEAFLGAGQRQKAFDALRQARDLDPRNEKARKLLGELEGDSGVEAFGDDSRPKTNTKVYPAQRAQLVRTNSSAEAVVGEGAAGSQSFPSMDEWGDEEEDTELDDNPFSSAAPGTDVDSPIRKASSVSRRSPAPSLPTERAFGDDDDYMPSASPQRLAMRARATETFDTSDEHHISDEVAEQLQSGTPFDGSADVTQPPRLFHVKAPRQPFTPVSDLLADDEEDEDDREFTTAPWLEPALPQRRRGLRSDVSREVSDAEIDHEDFTDIDGHDGMSSPALQALRASTTPPELMRTEEPGDTPPPRTPVPTGPAPRPLLPGQSGRLEPTVTGGPPVSRQRVRVTPPPEPLDPSPSDVDRLEAFLPEPSENSLTVPDHSDDDLDDATRESTPAPRAPEPISAVRSLASRDSATFSPMPGVIHSALLDDEDDDDRTNVDEDGYETHVNADAPPPQSALFGDPSGEHGLSSRSLGRPVAAAHDSEVSVEVADEMIAESRLVDEPLTPPLDYDDANEELTRDIETPAAAVRRVDARTPNGEIFGALPRKSSDSTAMVDLDRDARARRVVHGDDEDDDAESFVAPLESAGTAETAAGLLRRAKVSHTPMLTPSPDLAGEPSVPHADRVELVSNLDVDEREDDGGFDDEPSMPEPLPAVPRAGGRPLDSRSLDGRSLDGRSLDGRSLDSRPPDGAAQLAGTPSELERWRLEPTEAAIETGGIEERGPELDAGRVLAGARAGAVRDAGERDDQDAREHARLAAAAAADEAAREARQARERRQGESQPMELSQVSIIADFDEVVANSAGPPVAMPSVPPDSSMRSLPEDMRSLPESMPPLPPRTDFSELPAPRPQDVAAMAKDDEDSVDETRVNFDALEDNSAPKPRLEFAEDLPGSAAPAPADRLPDEQLAPEQLPPEQLAPEQLPPENLPPEQLAPERLPSDDLGPMDGPPEPHHELPPDMRSEALEPAWSDVPVASSEPELQAWAAPDEDSWAKEAPGAGAQQPWAGQGDYDGGGADYEGYDASADQGGYDSYEPGYDQQDYDEHEYDEQGGGYVGAGASYGDAYDDHEDAYDEHGYDQHGFDQQAYDEHGGGYAGANGHGGYDYDAPSHLDEDFPPSVSLPERRDADELAVESADSYGASPAAQPSVDAFDDAYDDAYDDPYHEMSDRGHRAPTAQLSEEEAYGRGQRHRSADEVMLEQMTGGHQMQQVRESVQPRVIDRRKRPPSEGARARSGHTTSFLTMLLGDPGSHRWVFLLLGSLGVLALAVGVGLLVRYLRVSDEIENKRTAAVRRLDRGNLADFRDARQMVATILARRGSDDTATALYARIIAAIPVEFGDQIPEEQRRSAEPKDDEARRAVAIYRALAEGALAKADKLADTNRKAHPRSALLRYLDGRVQLLKGIADAAASYLERAHELNSKDLLALRWLAAAQRADGQLRAASKTIDKALKLNPDHIGSLLVQIQLRLDRGREIAKVEVELNSIIDGSRRKLASQGEVGWAHLARARLRLRQGQNNRARGEIRRAKASRPAADPSFYDELAGLWLAVGKLGEALVAVEKSERMMPGRPYPAYRKAQIYLAHGRAAEALAALKRSASVLKVSSVLRARILLKLGKLSEALAAAEKAVRKRADDVNAKIVKAEVLAAQRRYADARALLSPLLSRSPRNAKLLMTMGRIYLGQGQPPRAIAQLKRALRYDANAHDARLMLADAYLAAGRFKDAHALLLRAAKASWNMAAQRRLAALDYDRWELSVARSDLRRILKRAKRDDHARLLMARVLTGLRLYKQCERLLRRVRPQSVGIGRLALERGRLALRRGEALQAVRELEVATEKLPRHADAWSLLVRAYLFDTRDGRRNTAKARAAVRRMRDKLGEVPEALAAAGRALWSAGKLKPARAKLATAVELLAKKPRSPRVEARIRVLAGRVYSDSGSLDKAASEYDRALKACPKCPEPMHRRAMVLDEKGRGKEAIRSLQRALRIDPRSPALHYDLGKVYENNKRKSEAVRYYRKYLKFNPPEDLAKDAREAINNLQK